MQIRTKRGVFLFVFVIVIVIVMVAFIIVNVSNWYLMPRDLFWRLLYNANGQLLFITLITAPFIGIKVRQLTLLSDRLEFALNHDQLTRVSTRHHLMKRAQTDPIWPCAVIIADLDRFKGINDTYGHLAGDKVLQHFADVVSKVIRQTDLIARYGGEEFVILLPHATAQQAAAQAQRICDLLGHGHLQVTGQTIVATASFGISIAADLAAFPAALQRADKALYAAKDAGRNRVSIAAEDAAACRGLLH